MRFLAGSGSGFDEYGSETLVTKYIQTWSGTHIFKMFIDSSPLLKTPHCLKIFERQHKAFIKREGKSVKLSHFSVPVLGSALRSRAESSFSTLAPVQLGRLRFSTGSEQKLGSALGQYFSCSHPLGRLN